MRRLLISLPVLLMIGCGGGNSSTNPTKQGHLMYSGANGLTYETQSQTGETLDSGIFTYQEGETISFSLGNLPILQDIPVTEFLSILDESEESRTRLDLGDVENNLSVHKIAETELSKSNRILNISRFLVAMDSDAEVSDGNNLVFTERNIEQLNSALEKLVPEGIEPSDFINFDVTQAAFEATDSPANQVLDEICFFPETSVQCQSPPTQDEIDNAPTKPDNICEEGESPADEPAEGEEACVELDPDIEYSEDLSTKKEQIENGKRSIGDTTESVITEYLNSELSLVNAEITNRYYLLPYAIRISAADTDLKTVKIHSYHSDFNIEDMEVLSLNPDIAEVQRFDKFTKEIEFYITGNAGEETTLLINFKTSDSYRWIRKSLRVIIQE